MAEPYRIMVEAYARLLTNGRAAPLGGFPPLECAELPADAPKALIFAPHPDDECVIGGLPLRLLRDARMNVINVAVTQGSRKDRQAARWRELEAACSYIGFGLLATSDGGLERVNPTTRHDDPRHWAAAVEVVAGILHDQRPSVIFFPHDDDWNVTHLGTHWLVVDALQQLPTGFACLTVETEFWGAMDTPNLVVELSTKDVADLVAALSFHVGEVERNPFHLRLPAWMMDNVRRGSELVQGQGEASPGFTFATLYRLRAWRDGELVDVLDRGRLLPAEDDPRDLLR